MVPLGAIVLIIAAFKLKDIKAPQNVKVDLISVFTSLAGMALLLYGFSEAGNDGWTDSVVLSTMIGGIVLLIIFVVQQLRLKSPLLDVKYLNTVFSHYLISLVLPSQLACMLVCSYCQFTCKNIRGYSAFDSGLLILPGALVMLVMSPISGTLF